ncbi:hypothetical protein PROFUN_03765 [Planoprotostelium fungivorum]|uniref:Uncharacterized protein n=1 Tax=Planoprotostelium fungivorum TaxID=1890364 RepID=A0A2P6NDR9_9EUKA|nr:hypothetical protein PROFUN_03765 [Planoprotostelium fungivorum]
MATISTTAAPLAFGRDITNTNDKKATEIKKRIVASAWTGVHIRYDAESEDVQVASVEKGEPVDTASLGETTFSFSSPVLVKTDSSASDVDATEDFEDENDENVAPQEEENEGEADLWTIREPTREAKWCGTRVFFSSSDDEVEEDEEEQAEDDQMEIIEKNFASLTADA